MVRRWWVSRTPREASAACNLPGVSVSGNGILYDTLLHLGYSCHRPMPNQGCSMPELPSLNSFTTSGTLFAMRTHFMAGLVAGVLLLPALSLAQTPEGLDSIPGRMREMITQSEVPGAVAVVATHDSVLRMDAVGWDGPEHKAPMRVDSIFWIASMTKPITATGILMLMEEGKLSLDDPISKYIPELGALKTADGRVHPVTLRHLLTHTSGMGEATDQEWQNARTLSDLVPAFASKPLAFEPGSQWKYCQSGINTLGRIIEIVTGQPLEIFMQKRIFDPLGMKDTTFY